MPELWKCVGKSKNKQTEKHEKSSCFLFYLTKQLFLSYFIRINSQKPKLHLKEHRGEMIIVKKSLKVWRNDSINYINYSKRRRNKFVKDKKKNIIQ